MRKIGWARGYIPSLSPVFDCIFDCKYRPTWKSLQVWWCQVERRYIDTWNAVPNYSRPQTQTRLVPNPMKNFEPLAGKLVMYALLLQARPSHFHKKGNGPVYCVHKPYPTGMQFDRWRNQVSHNRLSNTHCKVCTLLRSIMNMFYSSCSRKKDVLGLCHCFPNCYCSWNLVMCHVPKYLWCVAC